LTLSQPIFLFADDRNMVESQLSYEKRLKDSEEIITRWRGDAGVLKKKNNNMGKECEDLRKEIELLRSQHARFQDTIRLSQKQIDDLKHDRSQRDSTIKEKEKQLADMNKRTQELEKYKQALTNKMHELKSEIEPRETEIREKKERIFEMERELKLLQQQQLHSGLKLSELRDKFLGSEKELKVERMRSRIARDQLTRICTDIHKVSNYIQQPPEKLKEQVIRLFHRYANNTELKTTLQLDVEVQNEFSRQREYYEKMSGKKSASTTKLGKKFQNSEMDQDTVKLLKENVVLITELNRMRMELSEREKENEQMKSLLGTSSRNMLPSIAKKKLERAATGKEEIHEKYKETIGKLEEKIEILVVENQILRSQIVQ
jgi:cilia- and flagella-associated protein 57